MCVFFCLQHKQEEISAKHLDLDHLVSEASELSVWAGRPSVLEEVQRLQSRWDQLASSCLANRQNVELEMQVCVYVTVSQSIYMATLFYFLSDTVK